MFLYLLSCLFALPFVHGLTPFDYYVFSRSWAPTFCAVNQQSICNYSNSSVEEFTIHGLWPSWRNGSWPQYCNKQPYSGKDIQDILPDLQYHWSDDGNPDHKWWSHEWEKHGTCAVGQQGITNLRSYFAKSLCLDLELGANAKNITPSESKPYNKKYLQEVFGAGISCVQIHKYGNLSLLSEIRVVVSLDLQHIEPMAEDNSCQETIYLLPYSKKPNI